MDYEYRILLLEKELAHYRELQLIARDHVDAHDRSISALEKITNRTTENLDKLTADVGKLVVAQTITEQKMQNLIDVIAREHSNGKAKP